MTKRGYTLVEVLIGAGITTVILLVILVSSVGGIQNFSILSARQGRDSAFLELYNRVDRFVRVAIEFPATYDPEPTNSENTVYTADADTIIMKLYSINSDGTICVDFHDYVVFDRQGTDLRELIFASSSSARQSQNIVVARDVSAMTFTQTKASAEVHRQVDMAVTIERQASGQTVTESHQQTMVARND